MSVDTRIERATLQAEFGHGEAAALDPENAAAVQGGHAVTTRQSRWFHRRCPVCQHTFRSGDEVRVSEDGTVLHESAAPACASGSESEPAPAGTVAAFFAGLDESWPPPSDMPVIRLEHGHRLLAPPPPGSRFQRHICVGCGHTLRPHDSVVICPCSPRDPICEVAIHRDPLHGLHCWEDWNPGGRRTHCPVTSAPIDGR